MILAFYTSKICAQAENSFNLPKPELSTFFKEIRINSSDMSKLLFMS